MAKLDVLQLPNYTAREAARFVRLPYSTVQYWTRGRPGHPPVIKTGTKLSFVNLVEIHMLGVFRRYHGIPLQNLRRAIRTLTKDFPAESHPLATRKFWVAGRSVLTDQIDKLVSLSEPGQLAWPEVIACYAKRVQWDGSLPRRLYPFTTRPQIDSLADEPRTIVIDPAVAFGRPVIAGTRITTATLAARFEAGEGLAEIAADYDLDVRQVEDAIRCEQAHAAA